MSGKCSNREYTLLGRDRSFYDAFVNVINIMKRSTNIAEFKAYSFLHYEKLRGRPESSVRIKNGRVERILFTENENGIEISIIELNTTHYGNKK